MEGTWTERADNLLDIMERFQQSVTDGKTVVDSKLNHELHKAVWHLCQQLKEMDSGGGQFVPDSSVMSP